MSMSCLVIQHPAHVARLTGDQLRDDHEDSFAARQPEAHGEQPGARGSRLYPYDISEYRRRKRLHRLLHGFGEPVQESLFLCWLDAVRQRRLRVLLDDFQRAPHRGQERVHCIAARMGTEAAPASEWICE